MTVRRKSGKKNGGDRSGFLSSEKGTVTKKWGGRIPVCIVFPNSYYVGMSNLATHILYRRLNDMDDVVCERCFFEDGGNPLSLESGRPLIFFEILFFTLSFELDYINIPKILASSSIHIRSTERNGREPLVVAGGICVMSNPEPVNGLFDLFIMGDIETTVERFMETYRGNRGRKRDSVTDGFDTLEWVYNPRRLDVVYGDEGTVRSFAPHDFNVAISRHKKKELGSSAIIADKTEFSIMFLIEGTRGCPSRCPFASSVISMVLSMTGSIRL
jgi:radical SAM superfamily enzyme YgiQ (UPF0313 family)